mmetsp:Transcript_28931/g.74264  ORF Transcript_28931/g.74264 Transcript_28931/m.74264 type:complete len:276 (-) Transcript_28931:1356-2183(-)
MRARRNSQGMEALMGALSPYSQSALEQAPSYRVVLRSCLCLLFLLAFAFDGVPWLVKWEFPLPGQGEAVAGMDFKKEKHQIEVGPISLRQSFAISCIAAVGQSPYHSDKHEKDASWITPATCTYVADLPRRVVIFAGQLPSYCRQYFVFFPFQKVKKHQHEDFAESPPVFSQLFSIFSPSTSAAMDLDEQWMELGELEPHLPARRVLALNVFLFLPSLVFVLSFFSIFLQSARVCLPLVFVIAAACEQIVMSGQGVTGSARLVVWEVAAGILVSF